MNPTVEILINRRSCKSYQDKHIEKEILDQIVEAGLNAPSGMNLQTPRLVVVTDDATVKTLSKLNAAVMGAESDPFYGAKDVIIVLTTKDRNRVYDGSLAMGNLLNAAFALGIGACWIHRAREVFESAEGQALLKSWGITEELEGIGFCVLGYEKDDRTKPEVKPGRVFYV